MLIFTLIFELLPSLTLSVASWFSLCVAELISSFSSSPILLSVLFARLGFSNFEVIVRLVACEFLLYSDFLSIILSSIENPAGMLKRYAFTNYWSRLELFLFVPLLRLSCVDINLDSSICLKALASGCRKVWFSLLSYPLSEGGC